MVYSPDGKRIVSGSSDLDHPEKPGELKVWDTDKGQELLSLKGHTNRILCVACSPDGNRIVSGSQDQTLKVWEAEQNR